MAEVMNIPVDSLDDRRDRPKDRRDKPPIANNPSDFPPLPPRRRDTRERRDFDRPSNRRVGGGGGYDRNRSPLPPPPRDTEIDYKRRLSPSPPPYLERRPYSPPRRSPPFKRSRREDVSPRGYANDRRFGHDHLGGYEHDVGGRPSYLEDKPHDSRSSGGFPGGGSSNGDSDCAVDSDLPNTGNNQREGLVSYKQFIQEIEDDVLPSEAEHRYQEYKTEYIVTQKRTYFEAHKGEEWLRNKYHPTNLLSVIERRNELAHKVAKEFLLDLLSAELDFGPTVNTNKSEQTSQPHLEDELDDAKRRQHGGPSSKEAELAAAPKAHPISSEPRRIRLDVELALDLARKLDSEKGIHENVLVRAGNDKIKAKAQGGSVGTVIQLQGLTSVKCLEGVELLDTLLTYLWRVHGLDYYGMIETTEPKGLRHMRAEQKTFDASNNGTEWEKKLDFHWQDRLRSQDALETMTAKEKIDAAAIEAFNPYVRRIRDEKYGWKYGCGAKGCTKLFHASEFVHKHLKLKHPELGMELTSKVCEDLYFHNYMNDPDAPGGQPVMQQPIQNKLQRRRTPIKDRLKDDRGNCKERDALDSGNGIFDKSDNLLGEFQSNNDDPEEGNADDPVLDDFDEQGMLVPPFAPDVPPLPVLMPVPGAGPLGPFVPAPPGVAKRMLHDQDGPPPSEARRSSVHSRLGPRSVRSRLGPAPIILPPTFQQDPRGLRSYQDLDASEDEVTVIDYRSL